MHRVLDRKTPAEGGRLRDSLGIRPPAGPTYATHTPLMPDAETQYAPFSRRQEVCEIVPLCYLTPESATIEYRLVHESGIGLYFSPPHPALESDRGGGCDGEGAPSFSRLSRQEAIMQGYKLPGEVFSREEVRAILDACSLTASTGVRNRALLTVLYRTGLRVSEALALMPADLDSRAGTLRVRCGKGRRERTVAMDAGGWDVLGRWMDRRGQLGLSGHSFLFCTL